MNETNSINAFKRLLIFIILIIASPFIILDVIIEIFLIPIIWILTGRLTICKNAPVLLCFFDKLYDDLIKNENH